MFQTTVRFADAKSGKVLETLTATPEHPFFVPGLGAVPLGKLGIGTLIVTRAGPLVKIASLVRHEYTKGISVYNFEVPGDHTYFVGKSFGGLWVHNDCTSFGPEENSTIVIGRNMGDRVEPFAEGLGADIYVPSVDIPSNDLSAQLAANAAWLQKMMDDGRDIIDIGHDPTNIDGPPSPFYELERQMINGYPKRIIAL